MKRAPIHKKKLSDEVRERLLAEIEGGQLPPGSPLPSERELMEAFGVGRPAIREAMQSLQGLGLIVVRHGERPRVAEPQLDLLAEQLALTMRHILRYDNTLLAQLKEARALLETELARSAASRQDRTKIAEIRQILDSQHSKVDEWQEFTRLDGAFHTKIAEMSGNFLLASVVNAIFAWLERFHIDAVRKSGLETLTLEEHEEIYAAIDGADSDRAAQAMLRHLTRANTLYRRDDDPAEGAT